MAPHAFETSSFPDPFTSPVDGGWIIEETTMAHLAGLKVAVIVEQGFEQCELLEPRRALEAAGAQVDVISPVEGAVTSWHQQQWGEQVAVDLPLTQAHAREYDALLLAGGVMNPDRLRTNERAVQFVRSFNALRRPIAAICHACSMLIEADIVRGKRVTSAPSIKTDLRNAGAIWVDSEVVEDHNLVTARKPTDIPAFIGKIIEVFARAVGARFATTPPMTAD
jgi:deglycase